MFENILTIKEVRICIVQSFPLLLQKCAAPGSRLGASAAVRSVLSSGYLVCYLWIFNIWEIFYENYILQLRRYPSCRGYFEKNEIE